MTKVFREEVLGEAWPDRSFVYVIGCESYVKIGIATDIKRRMRNLTTANPFDLVLLLYRGVPTSEAAWVERDIHARLSGFRHRGEWFTAPIEEVRTAVAAALLEMAKRLRKQGQKPSLLGHTDKPATAEDVVINRELMNC